ncbi:NADH-quinone oxidoreductase subunit K [bacterium]|nr:NADH-quinone oxidoreductase subunit K [bacterium]
MIHAVTATGIILILTGLWCMLTRKHIIRIIIGFSIIDTGIHIMIVSTGYIRNRTAPILDHAVGLQGAADKVVDPVPSALVLTAIVIGLAVTALMLSYAVKLYRRKRTLDINNYAELKW